MSVSVIDVPTNAVEPAADPADVALSFRELELGGIIDAYNHVTEKLKVSHDLLTREIGRLRRQLCEKDQELERKRRLAALGEMAAGVAHEVRNPLGGILLYATMLERDLAEQPGACKLAEQIVSAARNLDDIVGDILAFAHPQTLQRRSVDLTSMLSEVIDLLKPRRLKSDCSVVFESPASPVCVRVEPAQLHRAMLNVIANAIDAAGEGGHVWVRVGERGEDDMVCVRVADSGPGVPSDLRDRIFNPFFTTKDSGTGLGLAIVHRVVEAHGGHIDVLDRDGGGAVFALCLPAGNSDDSSEGN